jgi:predicted RNA-binding protein YlxR (DUF448 family)
VGCRARAPKTSLLRLVARDKVVVADPDAHLPGRGAYVHRDQECWDTALRRNALRRALRAGVAAPAELPG